MFKYLTNFAHKRSGKEAFGFYLAYLVLIVVIGALIGGIIAVASGGSSGSFSSGLSQGEAIGTVIAAILCVVLSFMILSAKKSMRFGFILLSILSGILALIGGGLLGLIIPAYFTSRENAETNTR